MENFLIVLLVKLLDPAGLIVIIAASLLFDKKWLTYCTALVTAVGLETFITNNNYTLSWGVSIFPGLVACLIHAFLCIWVREKLKKRAIRRPLPQETNRTGFDTWYIAVKKQAALIKGSAVITQNGINILDLVDDGPARKAYEDNLSVEQYAQLLAENFTPPPI